MSTMASKQREKGIVSLIVTLVMMIVITLIVLGFAEIARNEQRSSLDDQLSAQAYYAAESGINDVRSVLESTIAAGGQPQDKTVCGDQGAYVLNGAVDAAHNVSYSCVLVDAAPTTLNYTAGYTSTVVPLISGGANFNTVTISWNVASGYTSTAAGCYTALSDLNKNPPASGTGQWTCNYPVLRVDILNANGVLARANWGATTTTAFLVPFNSGAVPNFFNIGVHGQAVPARCNATNCTATINNMTGTKYYLRVTSLYRTDAGFSLTAGGIHFTGAQAVIDATGKAQDVLRRVLVAVDLTDANAHPKPSAALVTRDSVCKRFAITSGSFNIYDDMSAGDGGGATKNVLCDLASVGTPAP